MKRMKLPKWLICVILSAGLMMTGAGAFSDTEGHWAEWAIDKWSEEYQIIQGYDDGTFRPDNSITRGAFAGILDRFMHFVEVAPADTYKSILLRRLRQIPFPIRRGLTGRTRFSS